MALIGQAVSEEKIFEIVNDGRTTDRRTPEHGYSISSPVSLRLRTAKNEGARVATTLNIDFSHNSAVKGWILLKFELIRDVIAILVTSKYEEDPIKIEGARVATTQNNDFSNAQRQLTPQSEIGSS